MLDGLRKIRRQMTIEEQIQKSISMASIPPVCIFNEYALLKRRDFIQYLKTHIILNLSVTFNTMPLFNSDNECRVC